MLQKLEVLIGVVLVGATLTISTSLAVNGGAVADGIRNAISLSQGGSTSANDADQGDDVEGTAHSEGDAVCPTAQGGSVQSHTVLQEHVNDPGMPEGGVAGNQNALDKQCATSSEGGAGSAPGKSEAAPGQPAADPSLPPPSDQGQQNADANGNGPANNPGQAPDNAHDNGQGSGGPDNGGQGQGPNNPP